MADTIRVKIEYDGDGPAYNTKITDAETGAMIEGVARVVLDANRRVPYATLFVYPSAIDVVTEARVYPICPACKGQLRQHKRQRRRHRAIFRRRKRGLAIA